MSDVVFGPLKRMRRARERRVNTGKANVCRAQYHLLQAARNERSKSRQAAFDQRESAISIIIRKAVSGKGALQYAVANLKEGVVGHDFLVFSKIAYIIRFRSPESFFWFRGGVAKKATAQALR